MSLFLQAASRNVAVIVKLVKDKYLLLKDA